MKFCKDCKHYLTMHFGFSKCARTRHIDPVHGLDGHIFCDIERRDAPGQCGPEAKFFEPSAAKPMELSV